MFYVFNTSFQLQTILDDYEQADFNHHYFECDTLEIHMSFEKETYLALQTGFILWRKESNKGYRIHTIDVDEQNHSLSLFCFGLESILDQRILMTSYSRKDKITSILGDLATAHMMTSSNTQRNIPHLTFKNSCTNNESIEVDFLGVSLYSIFSSIAQEHKIGYRMNYDPMIPLLELELYDLKNKSHEQNVNNPVIWRSEWGALSGAVLTESVKDYKNSVYIRSGDESGFRQIFEGSGIGFDRYEVFEVASDIMKVAQDENGNETTLSNATVDSLLKNRAKLTLFRNFKVFDFSFTMNDEINENYGVDYREGDLVSIVHDSFQLSKKVRIQSVKEMLIQGISQYTITFEE